MTEQTRFDRVLPGLFDELADARTPDYLEVAIRRASSRRQRPAWTFPGRWLPMQITTKAVPAARGPWRQIGVLALIGILIAVAAIAYVGSRNDQPALPAPPFGLANNGVIAVERDGDIFVADESTADLRPLVTGPTVDSEPGYSGDGTMLAFRRAVEGRVGEYQLMIARADGSDLRPATPEPLTQLAYWSFSPDGTELLVTASVDGEMRVFVLPVAGGDPEMLDVTLPNDGRLEEPSFRPPNGDEVLVMPARDGFGPREIVSIDRATGDVRTILSPPDGFDLFGASWSPTGDEVHYGVFDEGADGISARSHVVAADGSGARPVVADDEAAGVVRVQALSSDGSRAVIARNFDGGAREQFELVSMAGDTDPIVLRCAGGPGDACDGDWVWSPDDRQLIVRTTLGTYFLVDPATGEGTETDWLGNGVPDWQRVGP